MKLTSVFTKKLEEAGYELHERISAFSKEAVVYRAKQIHSLSSFSSSSSSQYVALKIYDLSRKKAADSFQRECQVLSALHHHNGDDSSNGGSKSGRGSSSMNERNSSHLQSYEQFTISLASSSSTSASSLLRRVRKGSSSHSKLFGVVALELLQLDGVDALSKLGPGHLSESLALSIFLEVCLQLQTLSSLGFAHCDIKPDNILLNVAPSSSSSSSPQLVSVKVCDFGSSRPRDEMLQCLVGTDLYFPPEVRAFSLLKKHSTPRLPMVAEKCDIWCLGVTLFCFFTGMLPYLYEDGAYLFNEIAMLEIPSLPRSLITSMLSFEPEDRPTLDQILQHDWLKERKF